MFRQFLELIPNTPVQKELLPCGASQGSRGRRGQGGEEIAGGALLKVLVCCSLSS